MSTGCAKCNKSFMEYGKQCPKHLLEYKKWKAEQAQNEYMEELKAQSMKGTRNG